ncbi:chemotaxis protein CheB [Roseomonas sp. WA12]
MIRALVVDDSGFMRMALRRIIEADGDLQVVGEASGGEAGVELAARLQPDVVTMDLEMPGLDGIAATRRLAALPNPPAVVVVSQHTQDGSDSALAALAAGAADVLWKGSALGGLDLGQIDRELRPRLRHWAGQRVRVPAAIPRQPPTPSLTLRAHPRASAGCDILVLAASTGGPDALATLFAASGALPVPCVVAQHMPADLGPDFVRHLASRGGVPVVLGGHGAALRPGEVVVIPGGTDGHLARAVGGQGGFVLRLGREEGVVHPSADMLFRSAALVAQRAVGVVLTGMGRDGVVGAAAMGERGMAVLAQSPESCVVAGMPGAVIGAGLATGVGDPVALGMRLRALTAARAALEPGAA